MDSSLFNSSNSLPSIWVPVPLPLLEQKEERIEIKNREGEDLSKERNSAFWGTHCVWKGRVSLSKLYNVICSWTWAQGNDSNKVESQMYAADLNKFLDVLNWDGILENWNIFLGFVFFFFFFIIVVVTCGDEDHKEGDQDQLVYI